MNRRCSNSPYSIRLIARSAAVAPGCGTGLPSSSTFHGAKCSNGVNAVPYFARIPSLTTHATLPRNASGSSFTYVMTCAWAPSRPAFSSPAFFSSMTPSGSPLTYRTMSNRRL